MRLKKLLVGVLTSALVVTSVLPMGGDKGITKTDVVYAEESEMDEFNDLNQYEIVKAMGAGWNLGNQLEANLNGTPSETCWGNPVIKQELISAVKKAGFDTIRIPISYLSYIKKDGSGNYYVEESWLNRIKEVVDMAISEDFYVIINMHGDGYNTIEGGWFLCNADESKQPEIKKKYKETWDAVAKLFKDYDEHLIFESMNEEFDGTTFSGKPNETYYSNINDYNQIFVDTVRQSGGNNDKRWLLVPGWNTDINQTVNDYGFKIPTDKYLSKDIKSGEKRLMISVHYYNPWDFAGDGNDKYTQWGDNAKDPSKVCNYGKKSQMYDMFKSCREKFVRSGYPVIIGEYGCTDKSSVDPVNKACREDFYRTVCNYAKLNGMVPVAWDNNGHKTKGGDQFGLFNRNTYTVTNQNIIDAIMGEMTDRKDYLNTIDYSNLVELEIDDSIKADGPKAGTTISDKKYTYKVVEAGSTNGYLVGAVAVMGLKKKSLKSIKIAATVKIGGVTYKVTSVAKNAFKKNKKVKTVSLGENVTSIGANAFANMKKLSKVTINSMKLNTIGKKAFYGDKKLKNIILKSRALKKIGSKAFKGTAKKIKIKAASFKIADYKKMFKKAGAKKARFSEL